MITISIEKSKPWMDQAISYLLKASLSETKGNKTEACKLMNVSRATFYRWIKKYNV